MMPTIEAATTVQWARHSALPSDGIRWSNDFGNVASPFPHLRSESPLLACSSTALPSSADDRRLRRPHGHPSGGGLELADGGARIGLHTPQKLRHLLVALGQADPAE